MNKIRANTDWSNPAKQRAKSFDDRFFEKINMSGPTMPHMDSNCWVWIGYKIQSGYGRMRVFGNLELCHRVSWQMHRDKIPANSLVLHKCDNPACVNPSHLFLGSYSDNAKDRVQKGRSAQNAPVGELSKLAKLTEKDVSLIRTLYPEFTQRELASRFNVIRQTISHIVLRDTWKHV